MTEFRFSERDLPGRGATVIDVALVLALTACVIAIDAHAPSNAHAYAQTKQVGATISTIRTGRLLLPRNQYGGLARKPQLYAWLDAPVLMLTGIYHDFTFRIPTVAASFVTGVLVYLLGRRWYGRRVALLAACLWVVIRHMSKMMYLSTTDMLVTMWITASIFCADRLLFHPPASGKRLRWAIALWATMILGAMSKGWGVLNLTLVGGMLALAAALWGGFGEIRPITGIARKLLGLCRLVLRRWWKAMKATHFGWGMLAFAAVLGPVWIGMLVQGGEEFRQIIRFEIFARVIGRGQDVPHSASAPAVAHLLYHALPATCFAIVAVLLVLLRRWIPQRSSSRLGAPHFSRESPILLPLCWIVAVVVPFSLTHGFRQDYLLPSYAAVALMGGWAIEEVRRRGQSGGRVVSFGRHMFAAAALLICLFLIVMPPVFLFHQHMPKFVTKNLPVPPIIEPETWWIIAALVPLGIAGFVLAVRASLKWRVRLVVAIAIVAMLGVMFLERHTISRHARTGDGERLLRFGRKARPIVGSDDFAVARAESLGPELYIGRFGVNLTDRNRSESLSVLSSAGVQVAGLSARQRQAWAAIEILRRNPNLRWLITCDKGLVELGAAEIDASSSYRPRLKGRKVALRTLPESFGSIELSTEPIVSRRYGRTYLIRLDPEKLDRLFAEKIHMRAAWRDFASGKRG